LRYQASRALSRIYIALLLGIVLWPLAVLVMYALKPTSVGEHGMVSIANFKSALSDSEVGRAAWLSLRVGLIVSVLSTLLGLGTAHLLTRHPPRSSVLYAVAVSLPAFTPPFLASMAMLISLTALRLTGSAIFIVIAHVCYCSPFSFLILFLSYQRLLPDLEEAARNLGATTSYSFVMVTVPQIALGLFIACLVSFLLSWDEFVLAWFVGGFARTLPALIFGRLGSSLDPKLYAICALAAGFSAFLLAMAAIPGRRALRDQDFD